MHTNLMYQITYLRRGKSYCTEVIAYVKETNLQTGNKSAPRSMKKKREEALQVPEQNFVCSPW